jgi:hypothetical protein
MEQFSSFEVLKTAVANEYVKGEIDTVFIFSHGEDTLKVFKSPKQSFLIMMNIATNKIELNRNIRLGQHRADFYKKFEQLDTVRRQRNHVSIWLPSSSIDFYFRSDTLYKVSWSSDFD